MKLSEEINLGRMLLKPVAGIRNDDNGGGCALGMADAAGGESIWHGWINVEQGFITLPCDCKGEHIVGSCMWLLPRREQQTYSEAIVHIFNHHVCTVKDWTLDRLIDWIKQIEPAEEEAPVHGEAVQGEPAAAEEQGRGVLVAKS